MTRLQRKAVIAEHPVIRRESPSQSRMEARSDASLGGALDGVLGFDGVDVPPLSQRCGVHHLAARRDHVPIVGQ